MRWSVIPVCLLLLASCVGHGRQKALVMSSDVRVADAAMASGMPQAALEVTRQILQEDPHNIEAWLRQADALIAMGRPDAAEECYQRVLADDPKSSEGLRGLGRSRLVTGDAPEAEAAFRKAIDVAPNDAAALNNLGIALDLQERHEEAQAVYRAALTERPKMVAAQVNLGLSLALVGATDLALSILAPLGRDPAADGRIRQDLAVALALAGDHVQAGKILAGDMPRDDVAAALAGYAALKVPVK